MAKREFQFIEGNSSKFWAIEQSGKTQAVWFGRIGTAGQMKMKDFSSDGEAEKSCAALISEKLRKGYVEVTGGGAVHAMPPARPASAPPAPKVIKQDAPSPIVEAEKDPASVATRIPSTEAAAPDRPGRIEAEARLLLDPADWLWATWRPRIFIKTGRNAVRQAALSFAAS